MPLFTVEVSQTVVVEADDEHHAYEIALIFKNNIMEDLPDVIVYGQINKEEDLPLYWNDNCLPYGGDGKTKIKHIL